MLGFKVPSEVSVVGFDDLPMARWAWPPLTTVRQPLTEMAAAATRIVLGQTEQRSVELATSLVPRQSTARLQAGQKKWPSPAYIDEYQSMCQSCRRTPDRSTGDGKMLRTQPPSSRATDIVPVRMIRKIPPASRCCPG